MQTKLPKRHVVYISVSQPPGPGINYTATAYETYGGQLHLATRITKHGTKIPTILNMNVIYTACSVNEMDF
jgi:hypothetical protein